MAKQRRRLALRGKAKAERRPAALGRCKGTVPSSVAEQGHSNVRHCVVVRCKGAAKQSKVPRCEAQQWRRGAEMGIAGQRQGKVRRGGVLHSKGVAQKVLHSYASLGKGVAALDRAKYSTAE